MEYLDIINERDEVVGQAPRKGIHERHLMHRIVHILVSNAAGEMLLQKRSEAMKYCPGYWCTSVGGHVAAGETVEIAAKREAEEEIGLVPSLGQADRLWFTDPASERKLLTIFRATSEGPFTPQPEEVADLQFFSFAEIRRMRQEGAPFHPELLFILDTLFADR